MNQSFVCVVAMVESISSFLSKIRLKLYGLPKIKLIDTHKLVHTHTSFLDQVSKAGESAQEYLELLHRLTSDHTHKWKSYLAMRGVLPQIGDLIAAEIEHMSVLEDSTMSFNLSQGYALKMLTGEGVWSISDRLHVYYTTVLCS